MCVLASCVLDLEISTGLELGREGGRRAQILLSPPTAQAGSLRVPLPGASRLPCPRTPALSRCCLQYAQLNLGGLSLPSDCSLSCPHCQDMGDGRLQQEGRPPVLPHPFHGPGLPCPVATSHSCACLAIGSPLQDTGLPLPRGPSEPGSSQVSAAPHCGLRSSPRLPSGSSTINSSCHWHHLYPVTSQMATLLDLSPPGHPPRPPVQGRLRGLGLPASPSRPRGSRSREPGREGTSGWSWDCWHFPRVSPQDSSP